MRRIVADNNAIVQSSETEEEPREEAFATIVAQLSAFIEGDVFRIMRPGDRVEFKKFQETLKDKSANAARFDVEGLDKYLDSLMAVSQRDVLIKHDRDESLEISGLLEAAKPLLDISPHGALEMLAQAFDKSTALYGLRNQLDDLLSEWQGLSADEHNDPNMAMQMGERLAPLVREIA